MAMTVFSASGLGMLVMAGFLALAAVAQLNDPDPLVWMAAYGLPAVLTLWTCITDIGKGAQCVKAIHW
ncbi:hypothetical protein GBAR_LOCUS19278 [Geodia barretti]|uniref:Uncharacterized protein n=1 Tax=Geodia barretti TaxID=519541 RepID=A0AA35ST15_GEOBA|nr:hypothetical protein GBAR_LOCUS19278 [Geodia barretti]